MSSEPPPGSGQPPEDDPFRKQPPPAEGSGSPYDPPQGSQPPPSQGGQYGGGPYGGDPYGGGSYPTDPLSGMPPLADSGKRTLARIIDLILVGIVAWLLTWGFGVSEYDVDSDKVQYGKSLLQSLVAAVLYIGYDTVMISRSGQTLGKKWLGMRVANLDNGSTPSVQTTLIRSAVLWIPFAFCCACIWTAISGGWSFFDKPYKQGLHDKAAKTVVVSTN
ncbi:RDD family protein [Streptomyces fulvoviolaceus]|uniref:RDD family protein n=1 Tax=Streptomyces fulvoviolaceus TaxID=285535 RepID=UPI0004C64387|nr:RDD family protein [Streptomyces fulvoviolaceus]MCT9082451.1 RDD family protein [Streptomyces fulvoviolaceus]